jgi:branched-chain amino acid aminotransferase
MKNFKSFLPQLFEGMKAYRGVDGKIRMFRPDKNMARMNATAKRAGLPTFDGVELINCIRKLIKIDEEWVPHSDKASLYIRPTLIGTEVQYL